jgi:hypothetical protein
VDPRLSADVRGADIGYAPTNGSTTWEVELVSGAVYRVVFDGCCDIKPGLLETEAHTTGAGEEIHSNRSPLLYCSCHR